MDEVKVTIVFLLPKANGVYETKEFPGIVINTNAPFPKLKKAIIEAFPEVDISDADNVQLMVQASDGSPKSGVRIREGDRIVIMPTYTGPIVKRPKG